MGVNTKYCYNVTLQEKTSLSGILKKYCFKIFSYKNLTPAYYCACVLSSKLILNNLSFYYS